MIVLPQIQTVPFYVFLRKKSGHFRTYPVTAGAYGRPDARLEVRRLCAELQIHGAYGHFRDPVQGSFPPGMDRSHRLPDRIEQEYGNAIRCLYGKPESGRIGYQCVGVLDHARRTRGRDTNPMNLFGERDPFTVHARRVAKAPKVFAHGGRIVFRVQSEVKGIVWRKANAPAARAERARHGRGTEPGREPPDKQGLSFLEKHGPTGRRPGGSP